MRRFKLSAAVALALVTSVFVAEPPPAATAQAEKRLTGRLTGTVVDGQGVRVPGASITLESLSLALRFESDEDGEFDVDLKPGVYKLIVSAPGFKRHITTALVIKPDAAESVSVRLKIRPSPTTDPKPYHRPHWAAPKPTLVSTKSLAVLAGAQRGGSAPVCGDPTVNCRTIANAFNPHDLQFRLRTNSVIWESKPFYAIILKSVRVADEFDECEKFIAEADRLEAQGLFPRNKVFTSRCVEPGNLYYTNTDPKQRLMAVYAGRTRVEADRLLAHVRVTGKYPGANVRRMRAGFNGT